MPGGEQARTLRGTSPRDPGGKSDWPWKELGTAPGERVEVDFYLWREEGRLETRTARFRLAGVYSMGGDVGASLAPDFPGLTNARSITAWDPPFPIDLRRIRPRDEEYWGRYRATPKAFVTLSKGQQLWQSRFGRLTSVRMADPDGRDSIAVQAALEEKLRGRLDPMSAGFSVNAVKERGLESARGSTDFGQYFVYFSFFLIGFRQSLQRHRRLSDRKIAS